MFRLGEGDPRFRHLEAKVGALTLCAVVGITGIVLLIGMEKEIFTRRYHLSFVAESGAGFLEGMPVKLSGFRVGRIRGIELTEDARVRVTAEINRRYQTWIRDGSVGRLTKEGLIGETFVEITPGKTGGKILEGGESLPYEKGGDMQDLVMEGKAILSDARSFLQYVNSPTADLKVALGNTRELAAGLLETSRTLEAAVSETRRTVAEIGAVVGDAKTLIDHLDRQAALTLDTAARALKNVEALSLELEPVVGKIKTIAENAEKATDRLPALVGKVDGILENVKTFTESISTEGPRIRDVLTEAEAAVKDGREIIKGAKESWPIRLMLPKPKGRELIPLDGYFSEREQ